LASWEILQPIQSRWEMDRNGLIFYDPGSIIDEVLNTKN